MRLVVTGGGTGGHVYPALEIARAARDAGWEVLYLGSQRGQEVKLCREMGLEFAGFPSEPLYSLKTIRGMRAALNIARSTTMAKRALSAFRPNAVFSTGGYSSAPVVSAARGMHLPYVIHEQNSVPGRTNRILGKQAYAIATTFKSGAEYFDNPRVVRTGLPIRRELRDSAQGRLPFKGPLSPEGKPLIFVMGGSQGAMALNEAALSAAVRMEVGETHWLIAAGHKHYDAMLKSKAKLAASADVDIRAYLDAEEIAQAFFSASVVVCRSGGSLAEVAAFRKPSVLIPYPASFADHQKVNAEEFVAMGAAQMLPQSDLSAGTLDARVRCWLSDPAAVEQAHAALADWDIPDTTSRIMNLLGDAAKQS